MRILICDDDTELSQQLKEILITFFRKNSLKLPEIIMYNNGEKLLKDPESKDIVFLDIEMPGMNGIYVGNELKQKNKNTIIFVITSYSQYLDEAMRFHVFRYLSKPLEKQRIFRNMKDALALYNSSIIKISIETKDGIFIDKGTFAADDGVVAIMLPGDAPVYYRQETGRLRRLDMDMQPIEGALADSYLLKKVKSCPAEKNKID